MSSKPFRRKHEDWEFIPAFLSKSQREDPIKTVRFFCGWFTLQEARFFLMDMLRAAMGSETWRDDDPEQKAHVIWVIKELIDLIEGVYLMDEMIHDGQLIYSIKSSKV